MAAQLGDLYTDPTRARIAAQAAALAELVADCQRQGRTVQIIRADHPDREVVDPGCG